ncbi:MAG: hypothetical protein EX269_08650, partial [Acidimicrobiales bacterium]
MSRSTMEAPVASVAILGPLDVRLGADSVPLTGERSRRILATLVDGGATGATVGRLAELIWDDDDRPLEPTAHVRTAISRLRRQLAGSGVDVAAVVESMPGGYRLADGVDVDAWLFESELRDAPSVGSPRERLEFLDRALERWRGEPYSGFEDVVELAPAAARMVELRLDAEERRLSLLLELGDVQRAAVRGRLLADSQPWREELQRLHALALYQSGRQSDALDVIATYGQRVRSELGLDPGPELRDLESAILNHDAALRRHQPTHQALRGYELQTVLNYGRDDNEILRRRASQAGDDRDVVIESMTLDASHRPEDIERYVDRIDRRAAIVHPAIEPVLDRWREPGALHVVVPLYPTRLDDELAVALLDVRGMTKLVVDIAAGLDHLHAHGVVHAAVAEQTVFSDRRGRRRLGAFPPDPGRASFAEDVAALSQLAIRALAGTSTADRSSIEASLASTSRPLEAAELLIEARDGKIDRAGELAERLASLSGIEDSGSAGDSPENPYPGLSAFAEIQHRDFHGREAVVEELFERWRDVSASRLVVLTGASGSGKSSTLLAGVVPAIRRGALPGSDRWAIASMRPGADPIAALGNALAAIATTASADPVAVLQKGGEPAGLIEQAIDVSIGPDRELLLIVDQFEELFSITDIARADAFTDLLAQALTTASRVRVIASLRADWLDRPLQRQPFAGVFRESVVPLAPLTSKELDQAIVRPAADRGVEITVALRERLVADVLAEQGALPLVSVALHELWRLHSGAGVIDLEDYDRLGGLAGALVGRAEALADQLGKTGVAELRRLFGRVVSVDTDRRPVGRAAKLSEVLSAGITQATIDAAIDARLISVDRDPETREPMLSPTHDSLLEHWPRLADWLRDDRTHLLEHGRLTDAADTWSRDDRDPALLLRSSRLDRALELDSAGVSVSTVEAALISASVEEQERTTRE